MSESAVVGFARIVIGVDESQLKSGFTSAAQSADKFKAALKANLNDVERSMAAPTLAVKRLEASLRGDALLKSANNLTAATTRIGGAAKLTEAEAARLNVTLGKAIEKYKVLGQDAPKAMLELEKATRRTENAMSSLSAMGKTAVASFTGFLGAQLAMSALRSSFGLVSNAVIGMNSTLETTELQFRTLMGNADEAKAHVRDLFDFAGKTPFVADEIIQASRMMRTFGGAALDTRANLNLLGDASAATSAPLQELGFWVGRLYSNIAAGRPFGEAAMRLQELAVMSPQARVAMEALQKSGADASRVFGVFQEDLKRFTGSMELQAGTWKGVVSTLEDSVNLMLADSLRPFFETFRDGIKLVNRAMGSGEVTAAMDRFKASVQGAFGKDSQTQVQTMAAAMIGFADATMTAAEIAYRGFHVIRDGIAGLVGTALLGISKVYDAGTKLTGWLAQAGKVPGSPLGMFFSDKEVERTQANAAMLRTMANEFLHASDASEAAWRGQDAFVKGLAGMRDVLGAARTQLATTADATTTVGATSQTAAGHVADFGAALGGASDAATAYLKRIGALRDDVTGAADTKSALEWVDALKGVDLSQIEPEKVARINRELLQGIEAYRRQLKAIPADLQAVFTATQSTAMSWMDQARDDMIFRIERDQILDARDLKAKPDVWTFMDLDRQSLQMSAEADLALDRLALDAKKATAIAPTLAESWTHALTGMGGAFEDFARSTDATFGRASASVAGYLNAISLGMVGIAQIQAGKAGWTSATTAGGKVAAASTIASGAVDIASGATQATATGNAGAKVAKGAAFGAQQGLMVGLMVGKNFGPYGAAIGAAAGAAYGFVRSRMVTKDEKEARAAYAQWADQVVANFDAIATAQQKVEAGGERWKKINISIRDTYLATGRTAEEAMRDLDVLMQATHHSAQDVLQSLEAINAALGEQQHDTELLDEAMQHYGITIDKAGKAWQQRTETADAKRLTEYYRVLIDSGMDVKDVNEAMAAEINAMVQASMRMGTAIPSVMKPILDSVAGQGLLFDENGRAIDQLAVQSLNFADIWEDGLDKIALKLDKVIDRLIAAGAALMHIDPRSLDSATAYGAANAPAAVVAQSQTAQPRVPGTVSHTGGYSARGYHTGGIVRAHGGMFVGGQLGADEVPAILQTGEIVVPRYIASLMGGETLARAITGGNVTRAIGMMTGPRVTIPTPDPFAGMGSLIDSVTRPPLSSFAAPPISGGGSIGGRSGETHVTLGPVTVNVTGAHQSPAEIADAVVRRIPIAIKHNQHGLTTVLRNKVGAGKA